MDFKTVYYYGWNTRLYNKRFSLSANIVAMVFHHAVLEMTIEVAETLKPVCEW